MGNEPTLQMIEAQYGEALRRLGVRLTLIVSISVVAQLASHWMGG